MAQNICLRRARTCWHPFPPRLPMAASAAGSARTCSRRRKMWCSRSSALRFSHSSCRVRSTSCFLMQPGSAPTVPSAPRLPRAAFSLTAGRAPAGLSSRAASSQFIFGRYPLEERWRAILVGVMFIAPARADAHPEGTAQGAERTSALRDLPGRRLLPAAWAAFGLPERGNPALGRPAGDTDPVFRRRSRCRCRWASCWRSGRRSNMPVIKMICASSSSKLVRGVPLITRSVHGQRSCCRCSCRQAVTFDKFLRALGRRHRCSRPPIWPKWCAAACRRCPKGQYRRRAIRSASPTGRRRA